MMRLVYREQSLIDLEGIIDFVSEQAPEAAIRLGEGLLETCRLLKKHPLLGASRDDLTLGLRLLIHRGYGIYYRVDTESATVEIARFLHPSLDVASQKFD